MLPGDFEKYERFSQWMFSYAYDFTPDVEIGAIDEGYLDLTAVRKSPVEIGEKIQRAIRDALKITVSEGIGSNKLVSQIASKLRKPAAFEYVAPGRELSFLHPLKNYWLPGIGPKTAARLDSAGLAYIKQIAATPTELLAVLLGNTAPQLKNFANGIDERPVVPAHAPAKSYGHQQTFATDQTDEEFIEATLRHMADDLMAKVRADGKMIRTFTVKVRYNDMAEDQCGESLLEPTDLESDLYPRLRVLLRQAWKRRVSLRLVSLKLSNVYDAFFRSELPLETGQRQEARRRLATTVDELRRTHGERVVFRGHDFVLDRKSDADNAGPEISAGKKSSSGNNASTAPAAPAASEALKEQSASYHAAVLQRQRLGAMGWKSRPLENGLPVAEPKLHGAQSKNFSGKALSGKEAGMRKTAFAPLNVHSYYSFLDSTLSIQAIVKLAQHFELPAIALTDTANLHGAVEFVQTAKAAGIKPILGADLRIDGKPIRLYVENAQGYANLCRLLTHAKCVLPNEASPQPRGGRAAKRSGADDTTFQFRNFSFAPASVLNPPSSYGLLAVSPCPEFATLFPDRFYLEISTPEALRRLDGAAAKLPRVAALPIHYARASDRWKYDVVQSIRTLTLLRQEHPEKNFGGDFHFHTPGEIAARFRDHPDLLRGTLDLAERCHFDFKLGQPQFPNFRPPDGSNPREFLRQLVREGLSKRYGSRADRHRPQIELELGIISDVGYEEYFLVVWDILQECRRRGIEWITRGSAADSLVCYCLEISDVCPIRFDLYFRRFLNKERMALNKLPDIDVDFPHDRKDDVIDLMFEKYGTEQTAVVGGFSTYQARSALGDVAKVLGVSEYQIRRVTERLPHFTNASEIAEAVAHTPECADLPLNEEPYHTALHMADFLNGFPRYPKMHPCGLVLSRQPMAELAPCFRSNKGYPTTHFDMDSVEAIGLVKMDILAQGGLAVMRDVRAMLRERGIEVDTTHSRVTKEPASGSPSARAAAECASSMAAACPTKNGGGVLIPTHDGLPPMADSSPHLPQFNDAAVWEMIAGGGARAVHHIESPAMITLCKMCNVRDIDTLIAIVSVIRPGAANESKKVEFTRRYQGLAPVTYAHPSLEPVLKGSYGLVVYEEHILQICEAFAGLPPGRADVLRRALGKDKHETIDTIHQEFIACARALGRTGKEIDEVWALVAGFTGYAFCKAHSAAYGIEAYQSAWLKKNFPAEFMAGVLTNGKGFYQPLVYVLECHRLGVPLLPPWINEPGPGFTVVPRPRQTAPTPASKAESPMRNGIGSATASVPHSARSTPRAFIRVPVSYTKGLTVRTNERILKERRRDEFKSMADFYGRVAPMPEEMEILIRAGAFDEFGQTRTEQFWEAQFLIQSGDVREPEQMWLFPMPNREGCARKEQFHSPPPLAASDPRSAPSIPHFTEPVRRQRLEWEAELFGFPASGHPLELFEDIAWETYCPVSRLGEHIGEEIVMCGLIIEDRIHHQVTGEPMKFITLADWTGIIETELFASTYKTYGLATVRYPVLEISAVVEPFDNGRGFSLRVLRAGKPRTRPPANAKPLHSTPSHSGTSANSSAGAK
ncbi:MAG: DNA polymerase III subunit alpha [Verrucomicrobiota bacterium]